MNEIRKQLRAAISTGEVDASGAFTAEFSLPAAFVGFQGHFPGTPVAPGVCVIAAVLEAVRDALGTPVQMKRLASAKFFVPIRPGDAITMNVTVDDITAPGQIRASFASAGKKVAQVSMRVQRGLQAQPNL